MRIQAVLLNELEITNLIEDICIRRNILGGRINYSSRTVIVPNAKLKSYSSDTIYARYHTEVGKDNKIPLWLLGFLY